MQPSGAWKQRTWSSWSAAFADDGVFVVEALVPDWGQYRGGYVDAEDVGVDHVWLDVAQHDAMEQRLDECHVLLTNRGVQLNPVVTRHAWPSELDLMARLAGLRLRERYAGWSREPFTGTSRNNISVYGR